MRWLALALLLAAPAFAREGPDNPIYVTAATAGNTGTFGCNTADNDPYPCCNNPAADTCDTTLNGADICAALELAEDAADDGKIERVILPEGTITEAEHYIYGTRYWTPTASTPCGGDYGDEGGWPDGLVVQGRGKGRTILQATAPARSASGVDSRSIVTVASGGSPNALSPSEMPYIVYQNMTIDGISNLQPVTIAGLNQIGFSMNGRNDQWDVAPKVPFVVLRDLRIERTAGANMQGGSTSTPTNLTGGGTGRIEGNFHVLRSEFSKSGCAQPHSEGTGSAHPGVFGCGCDIDASCGGWNDYAPNCTALNTPDPCCTGLKTGNNTEPGNCCSCSDCAFCPGQKLDGGNYMGAIPSNLLFAYSFFEKAPHWLLGWNTTTNMSGFGACFASHSSPATTDEFSTRTCGTGYHVHGNRFGATGSGAIDAHGAWDVRYTENTFEGTCFDENWAANACSDFTFANGFTHWVYMRGNRFLGNRGPLGVQYNWWRPIEGVDTPLPGVSYRAPRNVIKDETFEMDCRRCGTTPTLQCAPATVISGITDTVMGTYSAELPPTDFDNLQFRDDDAANNNCTASFYARNDGGSGGHRGIYDATIKNSTFRAGGRDAPSDKMPGILTSPSANRIIAYFNYLRSSRVYDITAIGTGTAGQGKVTFGVGTPFLDDMTGTCRGTITWANPATAALNDRTSGLSTTCP